MTKIDSLISNDLPNLKDIILSAKRISEKINHTPVMTSLSLNKITGSRLFFKCENFQKAGAFKARGANNAIAQLLETGPLEAVATHSSGNHAGALALAAAQNRLKCYVVMPSNSPSIKIDAVTNYGAAITFCEPTLRAREEMLAKVVNETGATFIHPYNNFFVVAGQGTVMLELFEELPDLECVIAPVGGGGLLSGISIAAKALSPGIAVYGAEPMGADDAYRSLMAGKIIPSVNPKTMADGLLTSLCPRTFNAIRSFSDGILRVSEEAIRQAMQLVWERMKIVVEPSGCVPLAAVLEHPEKFHNKKTAIVLSGGNSRLQLTR